MSLALYLSRVRSSEVLCVAASTLHKTASSVVFDQVLSMRMNCVVLTEQLSLALRANVHARRCRFPTLYQTCCATGTVFPSFVLYGARGRFSLNDAVSVASEPMYSQDDDTSDAQSSCGRVAHPTKTTDVRAANNLRRITVELSGARADA